MKTYILRKDLPGAKAGSDVRLYDPSEDNDDYTVDVHDGKKQRTVAYLEKHEISEWLEEKKPERWFPKHGDRFYSLNSSFNVVSEEYDCASHEYRVLAGNCFRTREQAEEAARRIKTTLDAYHLEIAE